MARLTRMTIGALAVGAALALSACSQVGDLVDGDGGDEPSRDPSGQVTESEPAADVFSVKVGDCIGAFGDGEQVSEIPVVPCTEPHDQEVYAAVQVPDAAEYPGDAAVEDQAKTDCSAEFQTFVGLAYDDSELYVNFLTPTADSWAQGDREILCTIYEEGAQTTGTLKDANR
ncbi:MAG TPA: septum formation family protein [Jiangellaceae bacterium]